MIIDNCDRYLTWIHTKCETTNFSKKKSRKSWSLTWVV